MTDPELDPSRFLALHRLATARFPASRLRRHLQRVGSNTGALLEPGDPAQWTDRQRERFDEAANRVISEAQILKTAMRRGVVAICATDPDYPAALGVHDDAPAILFVRGRLPEVGPSIAIVGSRRPDPYGSRQAHRFAEAFARQGWTIVSGGAAGIDTAAHACALEQGTATVAIVGCGLDIDYPASNRTLFERIANEGGCVASEMPLGTRPEPWLFPVRNRIIAAWADATVVVEAPRDSGALITARNAAEYGKEVFVVPGPVDTGRSTGGHQLIRDGAQLADSPDDILSEWCAEAGIRTPSVSTSVGPNPAPPPNPTALPPEQLSLWTAATSDPTALELLACTAGMDPQAAGSAATLLEMQGYLQRLPGNRYARITPGSMSVATRTV
jgi:DNA processing protein